MASIEGQRGGLAWRLATVFNDNGNKYFEETAAALLNNDNQNQGSTPGSDDLDEEHSNEEEEKMETYNRVNEEPKPQPFSFEPKDNNTIKCLMIENGYINKQINDSDLVLNNPKACAKAFHKNGPLGLLFLFLPSTFIDQYLLAASQESLNEKEASRGRDICLTIPKIPCVIGLDIAMSLCNTTTMKKLWSSRMFLGNSAFNECMPRDEFLAIRASLKIHSKNCSKNDYDPLWTCRPLFSPSFL